MFRLLIIKSLIGFSCIFLSLNTYSNDSIASQDPTVQAGFFNKVPGDFPAPLIGLVNIASGTQNLPQVGFVNLNHGNFNNAAQVGFANTIGGRLNGGQVGLVNTIVMGAGGVQVGFTNVCGGNISGVQLGFLNLISSGFSGMQLGLVNVSLEGSEGAQFGVINIINKLNSGFQFGFINLGDSIGDGIPVGLLSVIRHGGFYALEIGTNELYVFNASFKIGVPSFYSFFTTAFHAGNNSHIAVGLGLGSILNVNKKFYLNPEANLSRNIRENPYLISSFVLQGGFKLNYHFHILAGPAISLQMLDNRNGEFLMSHPALYQYVINDRNKLLGGFRIAVRFRF